MQMLMLEEVVCITLGGLIPVPESGMESAELELMFESWDEETMAVTDIAPTTLSLVVGVNVTLSRLVTLFIPFSEMNPAAGTAAGLSSTDVAAPCCRSAPTVAARG